MPRRRDPAGAAPSDADDDGTDAYYYYAEDRRQTADARATEEPHEEEDDAGIRMNSQSSLPSHGRWKRLDKDTFVGPDNEVRTKHDPDLRARSNAARLLGSRGGDGPAAVGDQAYNAFRRAEARQQGNKKGAARQGHGRAEGAAGGRTQGALDGAARRHVAAALNAGLIGAFHGVVKEGKEAIVYHGDGGDGVMGDAEVDGDADGEENKEDTTSRKPRRAKATNAGFDVAIKVFRQIQECRNRDQYIDSDSCYHRQSYLKLDRRAQIEV